MRQYFAIEGNSVYPWNDAELTVSAGASGSGWQLTVYRCPRQLDRDPLSDADDALRLNVFVVESHVVIVGRP